MKGAPLAPWWCGPGGGGGGGPVLLPPPLPCCPITPPESLSLQPPLSPATQWSKATTIHVVVNKHTALYTINCSIYLVGNIRRCKISQSCHSGLQKKFLWFLLSWQPMYVSTKSCTMQKFRVKKNVHIIVCSPHSNM